MRRFPPCPGVLPLGLLFGGLVLLAPARAASPVGFRGMAGMSGGMMAPAPASMMRNAPPLMAPGVGVNQPGFRPMAFAQPSYAPSPSVMMGRYGSSPSAMGNGGGYSGGGSGSMPYGTSATSSGVNPANGMSAPYDSPYGTYAPVQAPSENAVGGPLAGLLNAQGGLDWPLALRILPPGLETRDLRQRIDARAGEVQRQGAAGRADVGLLREANRDVDRLGGILADRADYLPVSQQATTEARQFLRRLRDALKAVP